MFQTYRLIWGLLTARERRNFVLLILMTMVMAVFDVVGVAGILPFMTVLARPGLIHTNKVLIWLTQTLGLTSDHQVMVVLGLGVLAMILMGMVVRAIVTYAQIRFSLMRAYSIASRLLSGYLRQDYVWFLSRNSADLGQALLSEIDGVIRESVLPAVLVLSNALTVLLIGALLFIIEPWVAIGATGLLLTFYLVIYFTLRPRLGRVGKLRLQANRQRFHVVQEISGGIKEVKVMGLEVQSLQRFRIPSQQMARYQTLGLVIGRLPRYALEGITFGGFILMVLVMMILRGDDLSDLVPLFGLIGMAGIKLFPALQQIYQELTQIRFSEAALKKLHQNVATFGTPAAPLADAPALRLRERLELRDLHFRYPGAERDTLDGFSAVISARSTVGVVGGTGAGKTTVIDLILGLLSPDAGTISVDGTPVTPDRIRAWQKSLGYVPQHIFLSDNTVAANIAFGAAPDQIDMAAVEHAARVANLHDFVMNDLPQGYQTAVGERGVRLSGGQRQRIGIARALYHNPDVLILDEATSALDNVTERAVMEAVHNLGHEKTIIMIAHRLSTVEDCDTILLLEQGQLVAQGTYQELVAGNDKFRRMANG
jgi:ATP-binding cassette, subfamily B, bacterial PglK